MLIDFLLLGLALFILLVAVLGNSISLTPKDRQLRERRESRRALPRENEEIPGLFEGAEFPALDNPRMVPAGKAAWLNLDDLVLAVERNGEAQAFPLAQIAHNHVVNTAIGGEPFLLTYCAACSSGIGYDPVVGGVHYTFQAHGVYNGLMVMRDRQSGSVWKHFDGEVLGGPLAGTGARLEIQPVWHTSWAEWTARHPQTLVLGWDKDQAHTYRPDLKPGTLPISPARLQTLQLKDDRLPLKEIVLGVALGGDARAYVLADFSPGLNLVEDRLDGQELLVLIDREQVFAAAFQAGLAGRTLRFSLDGGRIGDDGGNSWDASGNATSGPQAGAQLAWVPSFITEWYGWAAHHPETSIYKR